MSGLKEVTKCWLPENRWGMFILFNLFKTARSLQEVGDHDSLLFTFSNIVSTLYIYIFSLLFLGKIVLWFSYAPPMALVGVTGFLRLNWFLNNPIAPRKFFVLIHKMCKMLKQF